MWNEVKLTNIILMAASVGSISGCDDQAPVANGFSFNGDSGVDTSRPTTGQSGGLGLDPDGGVTPEGTLPTESDAALNGDTTSTVLCADSYDAEAVVERGNWGSEVREGGGDRWGADELLDVSVSSEESSCFRYVVRGASCGNRPKVKVAVESDERSDFAVEMIASGCPRGKTELEACDSGQSTSDVDGEDKCRWQKTANFEVSGKFRCASDKLFDCFSNDGEVLICVHGQRAECSTATVIVSVER